jgi:sugar lactone lactonase YvrE
MSDVDCVLDCRCHLGEGPIWQEAEQSLYWIDPPTLHAWTPATGQRRQWALPQRFSSFKFRKKGGIIVTLTTGIALVDLNAQQVEPLGEVDNPGVEHLNDSACDPRGRFWTGAIDQRNGVWVNKPEQILPDAAGKLYRVDTDGGMTSVAARLELSNGMAFSPDGKVFYHADSHPGTVFAYDYDLDSGTLNNKRALIDFKNRPGFPDGLTVDADGCVWVAEVRGGQVTRFTPDGREDRFYKLPVTMVTSVAFGGSNYDTLYITSMQRRLSDDELKQQPHAGSVFAVKPGVSGVPTPAYGG